MRYKLEIDRTAVVSQVEFTPSNLTEKTACQALKHAGKLKKPKQRKDKWIAPEERTETAEKLVSYVIRRIEFPRNGEPFFLSPTDRADARQAGLIACVESGFFVHGFANLKVLKAIRNTIQGRECLRLRCKREIPCDEIADIADKAGIFTCEETITPRLRHCQRDAIREIMRVLRASRSSDAKREKIQSFKSRRSFLFIIIGILTGKTPRAITPEIYRDRQRAFLSYLARGADFLRQTRKPANLAREIMLALEMHGKAAMQA